ncbi:MAG TPA: hypothetical protein EYQ64_04905 [Gemmatimonadetes bacterium]|nr:hypothetical protein [Gemmatimonadota bacterium]
MESDHVDGGTQGEVEDVAERATPEGPSGAAPGAASSGTPPAESDEIQSSIATTASDDVAASLEPAEADKGSDSPKKKKNKKKDGGLGSSRGIETMFRTSYRVHQDLVGLADTKANIMISVNGLIISIILATISPRIGATPQLLLPTSILLVGCVTALVYAVLAARPRVSTVPLTLDDIARNDANILFFGNFVNLSEAEFGASWLMTRVRRCKCGLWRRRATDTCGRHAGCPNPSLREIIESACWPVKD